jgi:site-specific DNA-methyltransferase (adenine-specific)
MTPPPMPAPARFALVCGDAAEVLPHWPDCSVDLVFFSPPYEAQRTYEKGMPGKRKFKLSQQGWVDWLAPIVVQCARLSRGLVCVNMSSPLVDRKYTAAVEWLVADLTRVHGLVCGPSPYAWVKAAGIPGSGGDEYHRRDWEPVYTFAHPDRLAGGVGFWTDNTAFGGPCKHRVGGRMSNRLKNGGRATGRRAGRMGILGGAGQPAVANPGNVFRVDVGGGRLGSKSAHKGEAPMPVAVAERFVCWFCPPGGVVLDPFAGTGTTLHAALDHGRRGVGIDVRASQVEIAARRLECIHPPCVPVSGEAVEDAA